MIAEPWLSIVDSFSVRCDLFRFSSVERLVLSVLQVGKGLYTLHSTKRVNLVTALHVDVFTTFVGSRLFKLCFLLGIKTLATSNVFQI